MSTPASAMASALASTAASTTPVTSGTAAKTNLEQWLSIIDQWKAHIPMFQAYVISVIEKRKRGEAADMQLLLPTNNPVTIYANPNTIVNKIELDCAWFNTARIEQPLRMALRLHCKPIPEESQNDPDRDETPPEIKFQQGFRHFAQMIGTNIEEPVGSGNRVDISYVHVNIGLHLLDHLQPLFNHLVTHCGVPSQLINRLQDPIFYRALSATEKTFYQDVLTAFRRSELDRKEIGELVKRSQALDADFSKDLLDRHMKDELVSGMVGKEKEFSGKKAYEKHLKDGQYFTSISSATYTLGKLCFEFKAFDLASDILSLIKKQDALCPSADWIKIHMLCTKCDESQTAENRQKRRVIMAQLSDCDHPEAQALSDRLTELHFGRSSEAMQQTIETTTVPFFVSLRENPNFDPNPIDVITEMEKVFPAPAAKATTAGAKLGSATPSTLSAEAFAKQVEAPHLQKENPTLTSISLMIACATAAAADKPASDTAPAAAVVAGNATRQPVNTIVDLNLGGHIVGTAVISSSLSNEISTSTLIKKLEEYGSSRKIFAETAKLHLCSPTLLDILLDDYESSTILELAENLLKEHGRDAEQQIEQILKRSRDPKELLWLFCLPKSPFGQVSFFLKDGQYVGRFRFYLPEGEKVPHTRGGNSGNPQGLEQGFSEMSIHLLEKFTGQGYGSEGLKMAVETLIKPVAGSHPSVYAGVDTENKLCLKPSAYPFLGLATTTGLTNIPSIKASMNAGFVPGKFIDVAGSSTGYPGHFDFRYPRATEETKVLQEFLREWINAANLLGVDYMKQPYLLDESGNCTHGFRSEILIHYHKLKRQYNIGVQHSKAKLMLYETQINDALGETYRETIKQALLQLRPTEISVSKLVSENPVTLILQYFENPLNIAREVNELPPIPEDNVACKK